MSKNIIFIAAMLFIGSSASAQERNPFEPYVFDAPATVAEVSNPRKERKGVANPLTSSPLSSYKVTGLIVAPNEAVVVVKTEDKREYFAYVGDSLGDDGGIIETVSTEGIVVNNGEDLLTVNVNNKFEIPNDSK